MAMSREQLQYSKHNISEEPQCDSINTALGKRPYQNNNEPSDTAITDDGTATKKQKIYFDSEEQGPANDKGPDIKRQKPNEQSD